MTAMKLFLLEIHPKYWHCELAVSLEHSVHDNSDVGFKPVLIVLNNLLWVVASTYGPGLIYPVAMTPGWTAHMWWQMWTNVDLYEDTHCDCDRHSGAAQAKIQNCVEYIFLFLPAQPNLAAKAGKVHMGST